MYKTRRIAFVCALSVTSIVAFGQGFGGAGGGSGGGGDIPLPPQQTGATWPLGVPPTANAASAAAAAAAGGGAAPGGAPGAPAVPGTTPAPPQVLFQSKSGGVKEPQFFTISPLTMSLAGQKGDGLTTVIPAGSYVKAKLLSGAETTTADVFPVLLQLDFAYQGPNRRVINFRNCVMNGRARANMSIERALVQVDKLSCVKENGEAVDVNVNGYVAGSDNNFGVIGTYISHQDKVLLAAVLDSLVKNIGGVGKALAEAQIKQDIAGGGASSGPVQSTNVDDKDKYILGTQIYSTSEAFSRITKFYLDQALALLPTIAITSGQDVWVVLIDQVKVLSLFTDGNYENTVPY